MKKKSPNINKHENILYNNILLLSRNKLFYTKFNLADTFQNRIYLIFIHISFLFVKIKNDNKNKKYKAFYQKMFDLIFNKIELNMREIGYGDVSVNKNMKFLVKEFYIILLGCEEFNEKTAYSNNLFFLNRLDLTNNQKTLDNNHIISYFLQYRTFCFDLTSDSVLKGHINFKYK